VDNQFNLPVIVETKVAEAPNNYFTFILSGAFEAIINTCCDPASV